MNSYTDCHNHVLPIDDGAQSWDDSINMLETAVESHISTVFVTPHIIPNGKYMPSIMKIKRYLKSLINRASHLGIDLKWGSEFQINSAALEAVNNKQFLCFQDTNYLLVEFLKTNIHYNYVNQVLDELTYLGVKVIIAHPERYFDSVDEALVQCRQWVKQGYYLQVNRSSIVKCKFKLHKKITVYLIYEGLVHLVASDAHHVEGHRTLRADDVYKYLSRFFNKETAKRLLVENPQRLKENKDLILNRKRFNLGIIIRIMTINT